MAKEFNQREGVDYDEIFSPVVRHTSIRMLLSLVIEFNMELDQMDVKTTFLHKDLTEVIYMQQPLGFTSKSSKPQGNGTLSLILLCYLV